MNGIIIIDVVYNIATHFIAISIISMDMAASPFPLSVSRSQSLARAKSSRRSLKRSYGLWNGRHGMNKEMT